MSSAVFRKSHLIAIAISVYKIYAKNRTLSVRKILENEENVFLFY